jgi:ribokinase
MAKNAGILSVGSVNLDVQVRAERWPSESETVLGTDYLCAGGGKAANVALVAARLGAPAKLFGRIGDDAFAELALSNLIKHRVGLSGVKRVSGQSTALAMVLVRPDGNKAIVAAPNANECWEKDAEQELARVITACDPSSILVVDLEVPERIVRAALKAARERGITTVLDPSPASRMDEDLFALSDYLTPNPREAELLTGIKVKDANDAQRAGQKLVKSGVRHACVKLPKGGAVLAAREGVHVLGSPRVEVVDQTGAGDAFAGGLAYALWSGNPPREAVCQAILTSTFAVTRYGAQASYPSREELDRFVAQARS